MGLGKLLLLVAQGAKECNPRVVTRILKGTLHDTASDEQFVS